MVEEVKKFKLIESITSPEHYEELNTHLGYLLNEVGTDENHPLCDLIDHISDEIMKYDEIHYPISDSTTGNIASAVVEASSPSQVDGIAPDLD